MRLSDFDYTLPAKLIAQKPLRRRDQARLLVVDKKKQNVVHRHFFDIGDYLEAGDVLILNDSKVIPARLIGKKVTGGQVEIFLAERQSKKASSFEEWKCLLKGKGLTAGMTITISRTCRATLKEKVSEGWLVQFNQKEKTFYHTLTRYGQTPLPPYIKTKKNYRKDYQTVYASEQHKGSVAAPTAGLHFTPRLLHALVKKGVIIKKITLHVGLGTFLPIRTDDIRKHTMHREWAEVPRSVMKTIEQAHKQSKRVMAVGTTTTRALEAAYQKKQWQGYSGFVDIFIYPPFKFKVITSLITNFHLPKSTLLLLVSALVGREKMLQAYQTAVRKKYRFFSFGDAMVVIG